MLKCIRVRSPKLSLRRCTSQVKDVPLTQSRIVSQMNEDDPPPLMSDLKGSYVPPEIDEIICALMSKRKFLARVLSIDPKGRLVVSGKYPNQPLIIQSNEVCLKLGLKYNEENGITPKGLEIRGESIAASIPEQYGMKLLNKYSCSKGRKWFTLDDAINILWTKDENIKLPEPPSLTDYESSPSTKSLFSILENRMSHFGYLKSEPEGLIRYATSKYLHKHYWQYGNRNHHVFYVRSSEQSQFLLKLKNSLADVRTVVRFLSKVKNHLLEVDRLSGSNKWSAYFVNINDPSNNFTTIKNKLSVRERAFMIHNEVAKQLSEGVNTVILDNVIPPTPLEQFTDDEINIFIEGLKFYGIENSSAEPSINQIYFRLLKPLGLNGGKMDALSVLHDLKFIDKNNVLPELYERLYSNDGFGPKVENHSTSSISLAENFVSQSEAKPNVIYHPNVVVKTHDLDASTRKDFTHLMSYAIDDPTTTEVDDSVGLEIRPDGSEWIHVHIADPTHIIQPNSDIDLLARSRGTTIYLPHAKYHMLPPVISEKTLSLMNYPTPSVAFSLLYRLDEDGRIVDYEVTNSYSNVTRITYDDVETILNGTSNLDEHAIRSIKRLYELTISRRNYRILNGARTTSLPDVRVYVEDNVPYLHDCRYRDKSKSLVEELMIAAGEVVSKFAIANNIPIAYRVQELSKLPEVLDTSSGNPMVDILRAIEFMSSASTQATVRRHESVALDAYARVTSPLRRYADFITHYQVKSFLRYGTTNSLPFNIAEVDGILNMIDYKGRRSDSLQKSAEAYWKRKILRESTQGWKAVIYDISGVSYVLPEQMLKEMGVQQNLCNVKFFIEDMALHGRWNGTRDSMPFNVADYMMVNSNKDVREPIKLTPIQ
eukprot:TRINITY_DN3824_c0_g1_i3.p1 TRINITY_DN3824_c0_g1~~TRINITY_DN3824_c0_g1_i3.p1  ORF type:complete len:881 (+),score=146.18 TRINITY_DN3824_c0_g1_i3:2316-4958(+)